MTLKPCTIYPCGRGFDVVIYIHLRQSLQTYRKWNSSSRSVVTNPHSKFLTGLLSKIRGHKQISTHQEDILSNSKLRFDIQIHNTEGAVCRRTPLHQVMETISTFPRAISIECKCTNQTRDSTGIKNHSAVL
jgi:hypothetical protein